MLIRRETPADRDAVRAVTAAAAYKPRDEVPVEVSLADALRGGSWALPALSLLAENAEGEVIGHALCSWGRIGAARAANLSLLGVHPAHRRRGAGSALIHALLGAADALDLPLIVVLGDPGLYGRYGFRPSTDVGIVGQEPGWGDVFQVRTLTAYDRSIQGEFIYPEPFDHV
ncbi:GNAT family N-acetyltransferase [Streptomyces sp. NPDC051555]|uniref:GNAT family N-acetyltransferase n=1 Tax=Streptomyces sp. NPDC051555 TaxID=3365657 RepID=UPI00378F7679